ncbi:MAG: PTPDL family protein [Chthoniobacteraceae bacterium]
MPKPSRFLPHFAVLASMVLAPLFADTITLTTGQKLEGKIVSETATDITVAVKISAAVTDEQTIPKSTIAKMEKEQPDEIAWQALKNLKPGVNSLPLAQYDAVLRPLQGFVNEYPQSAHAAEANALLAIFAGEKKRVEDGEVRLGEKWLTKEEVDKERYQIGALLGYQFMRSQRAAGDLIGALNSFEQIEKAYPGAKSFPDAVDAARETLAALKATVDRAQKTFETKKAEFEAGVAASSALQKPELLAARQRELAKGEAAVVAAEKAKLKWPVLVANSDKNLEAIAKKIPSEEQRLARIEVAKQRQSSQLAEQAQKELAAKDAAAQTTLSKALALWPVNELAKRLQPEAAELKVAAATAAATAAAATPVPTATPKPATPRPRVTTEDAPPEPEKPFFLTVGGMITIVVLLALALGGWTVFRKIKGRSSDILE